MLPVENVQDYPHRPRVEPVSQRIRVDFARLPLADTTDGLRIVEANHAPTYYIPPSDILLSALVPTERETICEWKGRAIYFDLVVDGRRAKNAAWSFPAPTARYEAIRDHLAFFATSIDAAWVGQVKVAPQPGDVYGGWVTPNLTGKIKGVMGAMHW